MHSLARRLFRFAATLSPSLVIFTTLAPLSIGRAQDVAILHRPPPAEEAGPRAAAPVVRPPTHTIQLQTDNGFGVFATVRDRSVDLTSPDHLVNGPRGVLFDEAAGLGWRHRNLSAMLGYMRPQNDRPVYQDQGPQFRGQHGRVGIGLSLHY